MNFIKTNILNIFLTGTLFSINMVIGMFTSRLLGPEDLGHFQVFSSTQAILVTILSLGLGQVSIYYINSKGYAIEIIITSLIKFFIPMGILTAISMGVLIFYNQSYFGVLSILCLFIFSAATSALLFNLSLRAILLANLNVTKIQIVQFSSQIFILLFIALYFFIDISIGINGILLIYSIANLLSFTILFRYFYKYLNWKLPFNFGVFKSLCKLGIIMSTSNLSMIFLLNSPVYALTWFYSDGFKQVGLYSRAISIMSIATFTIQAIGPLLYSKFSVATETEKIRQTKISSKAFFLFNSLIFCVIQIIAEPLIVILYGKSFLGSVGFLRILSFTLFFNGIFTVALNILSSKGEAKRVLFPILFGIMSLWIMILPCSLLKISIDISYYVVIANIVTALLLAIQTTKVSDISLLDYIPTRFSHIKDLFQTIKTGLK